MDTSNQFYEKLFKKRATQIRYDLSRMQQAQKILNFKSLQIPCVLIGGTNGKGSCAAFLWTLLGELGFKVALFTSPHMFSFEERFLFHDSEKKISASDITKAYFEIESKLIDQQFALIEELSFFEWSMLIALYLFSAENLDFIVWEVGMGGRLDATNITHPMLSILTSVGMDHAEFLGSSIEAITKEKLGICRTGRPLILGKSSVQEHNEISLRVAKEYAKVSQLSKIFVSGVDFSFDNHFIFLRYEDFQDNKSSNSSMDFKTFSFEVPGSVRERGSFMIQSLAMALQCLFLLRDKTSFFADLTIFKSSIDKVLRSFEALDIKLRPKWPTSVIGRFQALSVSDKKFYIDVAHNIDGIYSLIPKLDDSWVVCVSILKDKDFVSMLQCLNSVTKNILLFGTDHERSWTRKDLVECGLDSQNNFYEDLSVLWKEKHDYLLNLSANKKNVLFCGSVLAMAKVIDFFEARPVFHRWNEVLIAKIQE